MTTTPLVSICIPTYNGEKYLKECLDSIVFQSFKNIEIIIVDDQSTDATTNIISTYLTDKRIHLYTNDTNLGLVGNWNKCLEMANGEWIKFAFQDDILTTDCIQLMLDAGSNHSFVVCNREFIFEDSISTAIKDYYNNQLLTLNTLVKSNKNITLSGKYISNLSASYIAINFIGEPTAVLFKKKWVQKIGTFNVNLSQICDLEYWLKITTQNGLVFIPKKLVSFRIHQNSTTSYNIKNNKSILDPLILSYELLFNSSFESFRKSISTIKKQRLILYLKVKLYEIHQLKSTPEYTNFINILLLKHPLLKQYDNTSVFTKIIYNILILKRKF